MKNIINIVSLIVICTLSLQSASIRNIFKSSLQATENIVATSGVDSVTIQGESDSNLDAPLDDDSL